MISWRVCSVLACALALASCQPRDRTTIVPLTGSENLVWKSYTVAPGATLKIAFDHSVDAECKHTVEQGSLRVVTEPTSGRLTIEKAQEFPEFKRGDPRWQCSKRRVPGTLAIYRPDDGFVGEDLFKYDHYTADGRLQHVRAVVTVK